MKNEKIQKLTVLYQSAISLKSHEGELIWLRFSAFMVINTLIFTAIGFLLSDSRSIYIPLISSIGFILTVLWFLSTKRGFEAIAYWNSSIREVEGVLLENETIPSLYIRGQEYFKENHEVKFYFGNSKRPHYLQRSPITMIIHLNTSWTAYLSILLILSLYILIFFFYFLHWLPSIR